MLIHSGSRAIPFSGATRRSRTAAMMTAVACVAGISTLSIPQASFAYGTTFDPYPGVTVVADAPTIDVSADPTVAITGIHTVSGAGSDRVPVKLTVDSGTLSLGTTSGLTFTPSGVTSGPELNFFGTRDDVNAALATLSLTKDATTSFTVAATIWDESKDFTCDTGHFYRVVDATSTYDTAKSSAEAAFAGNGYLVNPTTDGENTCVFDNVVAKADSGTANITWIGAKATYSSPMVTFTWDGGPEAGSSFWEKTAGTLGTAGSSVNAGYANWDVETLSGTLVYQPNARITGSNPQEPCVVFYKSDMTASTWHDVSCSQTNQSVIEGDSAQLSTISITVNNSGGSNPDPSTDPSAGSSTGSMPNTGLSTLGIVLGTMMAGGMVLAASGSFSVKGRLIFAGRRERLVSLLRKTDASLRRAERPRRR